MMRDRDGKSVQPEGGLLPLTRGLVIGKILSARTLEGCERANALIGEWMAAFPDDEEMMSYGSFVARMESAIRSTEKEAQP